MSCHLEDSVYRLVRLSPVAAAVTAHPAFRRLSKIRQLSTTYLVFPHTGYRRNAHSIGVAYLARRTMEHLRKAQPELGITERHIEYVELAGLCHDLGHGPFSHTWDEMLNCIEVPTDALRRHEARSAAFVRHVLGKLHFKFEEFEVDLIAYAVDPSPLFKFTTAQARQLERKMPFLTQIVNNVIHKVDVDKMDYLVRDTQYWLAPPEASKVLSRFDIFGIIERSRVVNGNWCFHVNDRVGIETLIVQRQKLHKHFYGNPGGRALECMVHDVFVAVAPKMNIGEVMRLKQPWHFEAFQQLTDSLLFDVGFYPEKFDWHVPEQISQLARNIFGDENKWYQHLGDYSSDPFPDKSAPVVVKTWHVNVDEHVVHDLLPRVLFHFDGHIVSGLMPQEPKSQTGPRTVIYRAFSRTV